MELRATCLCSLLGLPRNCLDMWALNITQWSLSISLLPKMDPTAPSHHEQCTGFDSIPFTCIAQFFKVFSLQSNRRTIAKYKTHCTFKLLIMTTELASSQHLSSFPVCSSSDPALVETLQDILTMMPYPRWQFQTTIIIESTLSSKRKQQFLSSKVKRSDSKPSSTIWPRVLARAPVFHLSLASFATVHSLNLEHDVDQIASAPGVALMGWWILRERRLPLRGLLELSTRKSIKRSRKTTK